MPTRQAFTASNGSGVGSLGVTHTYAAGDTFVAALILSTNGITVTSVTLAGETDPSQRGTERTGGPGNARILWFVRDNVTGSGSKTATVTFSAPATGNWLVWRLSGCETAGAFDAENGAIGSGNPSVSVTTTAANSTMLAAVVSDNADLTAGSGYTAEATVGNSFWFDSAQYNLDVGAAGAKTVDCTTGGNWIIGAIAIKAGVVGPNIASSSSANPKRGSAQTVTGTAFGATQGTKQLRVGGVVQTPTSWADTLIGYTLAADLVKSGIAVNVEVWETSPSSSLLSNSFGLTSIQPALGWSFVDCGTPNTTAANRLTFSADAVIGDQCEWETNDGASIFTVASDLTFSATGYGVFAARLWTTGDGYGALADQTVNPPLPVLSAPGVSTFGSTTARPRVTMSF